MPEDPSCTHDCGTCNSGDCAERTAIPKLEPNRRSKIQHVIGIVSGKGGVGKSLVTSLLAIEMARRGKHVGILDADVTGPSIPKVFGIAAHVQGDADGLDPAVSNSGIKVMSTNLLLSDETLPVAWRGPVLSGAVRQFFNEVNWGELDYLFVDMPPGTSDVLLTVLQSLPVDGIVTVSSPQELVAMIVAKAVNLAHEMDTDVIGLVENMAYFTCPDCGSKHFIFGEPQGSAVAERHRIPAYATLPIDPDLARLCDAGTIEEYDADGALNDIVARIEQIR